jgi:hypothetical protein
MSKVKALVRATPHSKTYDVILEDGSIASGVEVYHSYKTFATAVVTVTVAENDPEISLRQMNGIATRLDPRFRLGTHGYRKNLDGTNSYFRNYYLASDEQVTEEFLRSEES